MVGGNVVNFRFFGSSGCLEPGRRLNHDLQTVSAHRVGDWFVRLKKLKPLIQHHQGDYENERDLQIAATRTINEKSHRPAYPA